MSREYAIDPLEIIFAREVARPGVVALPPDARADAIAAVIRATGDGRRQQRLYPVVDGSRRLVGVVTRQALADWLAAPRGEHAPAALADIINRRPIVAHAADPLRLVAYRMAESGVTRVPVVKRSDGTFVGMLALHDLQPRARAFSTPNSGASGCSTCRSGWHASSEAPNRRREPGPP